MNCFCSSCGTEVTPDVGDKFLHRPSGEVFTLCQVALKPIELFLAINTETGVRMSFAMCESKEAAVQGLEFLRKGKAKR